MIIKRLPIIMLFTALFGQANAAEHQIKMLNKGKDGNMVFEPAVMHVRVGDTVTFIPSDPIHDSISVLTPLGANTWHGKRDEKISVVINKAGIYIYKCAPHYYYGMVGVIRAGDANNLAEAENSAKAIDSKFIMNKGRLIDYIEQVK